MVSHLESKMDPCLNMLEAAGMAEKNTNNYDSVF